MPTVHEIERALFQWAPKDLAQSWDNVGLLVGEPEQEVRRVLVALDVTEAVVREAAEKDCQLIAAHHPVMNCAWSPVQSLRSDTLQGKLLMDLVRSNVAAICMHTNLDAAQGGVNDVLAARLGLEQVEKLGDEEGIGRVGTLPASLSDRAFLTLVRDRLKPNGLRFSGGGRSVQRVAVGGGACGDMFPLAVEKGCDAFVTADVKYNQFLDAAAMGLLLVDAGHFPTEDPVCPAIAAYLRDRFPELTVIESDSHREIVQYYV